MKKAIDAKKEEVIKLSKQLHQTADDLISMFDEKTCYCGNTVNCLEQGYDVGECGDCYMR